MKLQPFLLLGATAAFSLLSACGPKAAEGSTDANASSGGSLASESIVATATARMESRSGTEVTGVVTFSELEIVLADRVVDHRVVVNYAFEGLPPGEARGFHIHEIGDCSAPDASSAGGHFNPGGHDHGAPDHHASHAGDLGNVTADEHGRAVGTLTVKPDKFTVAGQADNNIIGRSVIVHVATDDLVSQPTGNAGARAACGVIEAN